MNSNIRNIGIVFVTLAMVVGVASMAPLNSVQADWFDVEDFGCVGVNNCNIETCTDTSTAEVNTAQAVIDNNNTITGSSTTNFNPVAPFTCEAGEVEEEEPVIIPQ